MSDTLKSLILSRHTETALQAGAYLLIAAAAAGLVLMFTGRAHLAQTMVLVALSSLTLTSFARIARHLAAPKRTRGPWPHRDTAHAALWLSMYPITLLSPHLDTWTFRLAALPVVLTMLYTAYAMMQPKPDEDPEPPP